MNKTLPEQHQGKRNDEVTATVETADQKKKKETLKDLLKELKPHLDQAKKDLLSPRQKAIDELLKKI